MGLRPRAGESANVLAAPAPAPDFFVQVVPDPDFFPKRLRLLFFFFKRCRLQGAWLLLLTIG